MKQIFTCAITTFFLTTSWADLKCPPDIIFEEMAEIKVSSNKFVDVFLNGVGLKKVFIFNVFYGALYLENLTSDDQVIINSKKIKVLSVHALRSISKKQLTNEWDKEFKRLCGNDCDSLQPFHDQLLSYTRDIKKGERISLAFYSNRLEFIPTPGEVLPPIKSFAYGKLMLESSLGKDAASERLKNGLLGLDDKLCEDV